MKTNQNAGSGKKDRKLNSVFNAIYNSSGWYGMQYGWGGYHPLYKLNDTDEKLVISTADERKRK